jgi:hypothetical protein
MSLTVVRGGSMVSGSPTDLRGASFSQKYRDVLAEAGVVGPEPGVVGEQCLDALLPGFVGAALGCRARPPGGGGGGGAEPLDFGAEGRLSV